MGNVPQQCVDAGCPVAGLAKGFSLPSGHLTPKSGIVVLLETPGPDDTSFMVKEIPDGVIEGDRRTLRWPELDKRFIRLGAPAAGKLGAILWQWLLGPMGIHRTDTALFQTLCCNSGDYPKGDARKKAEAICADLWMKPLLDWNPTVSVAAMRPGSLMGDIVPLPMVLRAIERAKEFASRGERVLLLMGGRAAKHWWEYGENETRYCGHFQFETDFTRRRRRERWERGRALTVGTKGSKKGKKLTSKDFLKMFCERYVLDEQLGQTSYHMPIPPELTPIQYATLTALAQSSRKKTDLPEFKQTFETEVLA